MIKYSINNNIYCIHKLDSLNNVMYIYNTSKKVSLLRREMNRVFRIKNYILFFIFSCYLAYFSAAAFSAEPGDNITGPEPKTLVKTFSFDKEGLFTAQELEAVLGKYRDKELSITDLKKIADELTDLCRKKGYITSMVYVPEQEIIDNTVKFNVTEGLVGNVEVEKPKHSKAGAIEKRLSVKQGQLLNSKKLEINLRRINKQPDRKMHAVLIPGATVGTSDILLKVDEEKSPQHFYTEFNNRGTKNTSKNRWGMTYVNSNFSGVDDILSLRVIGNKDVDVYSGSIAYDFPITGSNTRLGAYAAYSRADIGGQFAVLSPEGRAKVWGLYLSHPWLDEKFFHKASGTDLTLTGNLTVGFDSISVYNKILSQETSHDELRVFKTGVDFEETDNLGRSELSSEMYAGLPNFLGSMDEHDASASRLNAGGDFQKYVQSITRITRLPASSFLVNAFKYQFSSFSLVNSEQMLLGGADTVRGYPENEYLADYGWVNTVELRVPAFFIPPAAKVPFDKKKSFLADAVQLVGFLDAGKGHLNNPGTGEAGNKYLVGAGFGIRFNFYDHLRGKLDVGFPIGSADPSDDSDRTVYFSLQYEW
jgi:hemolysin activation/secretion protein